jgi:molecular chaperone HtpG
MSDISPIRGRLEIKDIQHILKLLIEDLYGGDPHLTLRELIQNAHDAIVELPNALSVRNRSISVSLSLYDQQPYIEILDNGIGMSDEEIKDKLCVVGDSDKLARAKDNPQIIGRFGIGFLSSFIVADHVEVTTRKIGSAHAWLWQTTDVVNWTMTPVSPPFEHGTQVRLYFKHTYPSGVLSRLRTLQTAQGLKEAVQHYAYLLPFPVYVGLAGQAGRDMVNCRSEPWESDSEAEAAFRALFSKDLPPYFHRFSAKAHHVRASGVLYFGDQVTLNPSLRLYVKRVLVDDQDSRLLPVYAPMMSGFVECPDLDVDLSRRQIRRFDPAYQALQEMVHSEYQKGFTEFATSATEKFMRVWPNIDKTFINRLLAAYASGDEASERRAKAFAIGVARYFPFFVVDTISGGLGRPLWMMIGELVKAKVTCSRKTLPIIRAGTARRRSSRR